MGEGRSRRHLFGRETSREQPQEAGVELFVGVGGELEEVRPRSGGRPVEVPVAHCLVNLVVHAQGTEAQVRSEEGAGVGDADISLARVLREEVGSGVPLMIDANCAYDPYIRGGLRTRAFTFVVGSSLAAVSMFLAQRAARRGRRTGHQP